MKINTILMSQSLSYIMIYHPIYLVYAYVSYIVDDFKSWCIIDTYMKCKYIE